MTTLPPPWLPELRSALDAEFADRPRVAALATVDEDGRPRVRSVVCRRVEAHGDLWLCSDARSAKNAQLKHNPAAELAFWLPSRREQYRVSGSVAVLSARSPDPRRAALWAGLADPARALFAWPEPGQPLDSDPNAFTAALPADAPLPASFEVLILTPEVVEHLDLNPHPHHRRRWRWQPASGWGHAEPLNP